MLKTTVDWIMFEEVQGCSIKLKGLTYLKLAPIVLVHGVFGLLFGSVHAWSAEGCLHTKDLERASFSRLDSAKPSLWLAADRIQVDFVTKYGHEGVG